MTNVTFDQSGQYALVIGNAYGSARAGPMPLTVVPICAWGPAESGELDLPASLEDAVAIASGSHHGLALKADGTVVSWGNGWGIDPPSNVLSNLVAIAAGGQHHLALKSDGTVFQWDNSWSYYWQYFQQYYWNYFGLGSGYFQAMIPAGLTDVKAIAARGSRSYAVRSNGAVVGWGGLAAGEFQFLAGLSNIVAFAPGGSHDLALKADGSLLAWGNNLYGQATVPSNLNQVAAIAAGGDHSLALRSNGTVVAWGDNTNGQATVPAGLSNVIAIAARSDCSLALKADGTVVAWGLRSAVPAALTNALAIALGDDYAMALVGGRAPQFRRQPQDQVVFSGKTVEFPSSCLGTPPLFYQWQYQGTDLPDATNATLVLPGVQTHQAGAYRVVVSNAAGRIVSPAALLEVVDRPLWILSLEPTNMVVQPGNPASFRVDADGSWPLSFQWLFNGTNLPGATNATLMVNQVLRQQAGDYAVIVSNPFGAVTGGPVRLSLDWSLSEALDAPDLVWLTSSSYSGVRWEVQTNLTHDGYSAVHCANSYSYYGSSALRSMVTGPGILSFAWRVASLDYYNYAYFSLGGLFQTSMAGTTDWRREVFFVPSGPQDILWSFWSDRGGNPDRNGLWLDEVRFFPGEVAPQWLEQPASQAAPVGGRVSFTATAVGTPPLSYRWRHNGGNLVGQNSRTLTLANLQSSQAGDYSVMVGNYQGTAISAAARLTIVPVPVVAWGGNGQAMTLLSLTNAVAIAGGAEHSLALKSDGSVVAWNSVGAPAAQVPFTATGVVMIACRSNHSLALRANGTVVAWNEAGSFIYPPPDDLTNVVAIAAGHRHSLALKGDGTVVGWGDNDYHQSTPPPDLTAVVAVAAGWEHSLALKADGTVVAWGANLRGELAVPPGLSNVVAIAAGYFHNLALRQDGSVAAWGAVGDDNYWSQWPSYVVSRGQADIPMGLGNVVAIAAGPYQSVALRSDGTVVAWGANDLSQTAVPPGLTNVAAISEGLALRGDGQPHFVAPPLGRTVLSGTSFGLYAQVTGRAPLHYQWQFNGANIPGANQCLLRLEHITPEQEGVYGLIVSNTLGVARSPTAFLRILARPPEIVSPPADRTGFPGGSAVFSVAVEGSRPLWYQWWHSGQVLAGATNDTLHLADLSPAMAGPYTVVISNIHGTISSAPAELFLVPVAGWGRNQYGQANLFPGLSNAVALTAGEYWSLALKSDGALVAWGLGGMNQIPVSLHIARDLKAIAIGANHQLALYHNGTVEAWFYYPYGYGNYSYWPYWGYGLGMVPATLGNVVAIAAGNYLSLALTDTGEVVSWGGYQMHRWPGQIIAIAACQNNFLALQSDGRVVNRYGWYTLEPVTLPAGLSNVVAIAAAGTRSLALTDAGQVVLWKASPASEDELAARDRVPSGLSNVVAIAAGQHHYLALKSDGTLTVWGANANGQTNVPPGVSNVVAMAGSSGHSLALLGDGRPVIVRPPAQRQIFAGARTVLSVGAVGQAPLSYQWRYNGEDLIGATNANLVVSEAQPEHAGIYSVLVSNGLGVLESDGIAVTVLTSPPVVTTQPLEAVVSFGSPATFTVAATGPSPLTYQWYRDGTPIADATNASLGLAPVSQDMAAGYRVVVSNPYGMVASGVAPLWPVPVVIWDASIYSGARTSLVAALTNAIAVGATADRNLALKADGTVVAWGYDSANPSACSFYPPANVVALSAGGSRPLLLLENGTIYSGDAMQSLLSNIRNVVALASGWQYHLALRNDGTVVCWNDWQFLPAPPNAIDVAAVAAGYDHCLALKRDGTVIAWGGHNAYGQRTVPAGLNGVTAIAAGNSHSVALRADGSLVAWGLNTHGQCNVPSGLTGVSAISAAGNLTAALRADGTVVAWGQDAPLPGALQWRKVASVCAGRSRLLAVQSEGLPRIATHSLSQTVQVGESISLRASALGSAPLGVRWQRYGMDIPGATNEVLVFPSLDFPQAGFYWLVASNAFGEEIGRGVSLTIADAPAPRAVHPLVSQTVYAGAKAVFQMQAAGRPPMTYQWQISGTNIACADNPTLTLDNVRLAQSGAYRVVLSNAYGVITSASATLTVLEAAPIILSQPLSQQMVFPGDRASLTVQAAGSLPFFYQWYFNGTPVVGATNDTLTVAAMDENQAGLYSVVVRNPFGAVSNYTGWLGLPRVVSWLANGILQNDIPWTLSNVVAVAAGDDYSLALSANGTMTGWDQVPYGYWNYAYRDNLVAIAAGRDHGLALDNTGAVSAWSYSYYQTAVPTSLTNAVAIAAGHDHSLAVKADGTLVAWGRNDLGQLNGPPGLTNLVAVAAGHAHSLALTDDGRVVAWGDNYYGQLDVPAGLSNIMAIAGGAYHSVALRDEGTVVAWGDNAYSQATVPNDLSNVVAIAAGDQHSLALRADGTVAAWGLAPAPGWNNVPAWLSNVVAIACGSGHNLAVLGQRKPFFTLQAANRTVVAGVTLRLAAMAVGPGPISYQWLWNGVPLGGATNRILTLANISRAAEGLYTLTASNAFGSMMSRPARVNVLVPPELTQYPANATVPQGSNVTFSVEVTGTPPFRFQWRRNGVNIFGATNATLTLPNVQVADGGSFSVVVANVAGAIISDPALLVVQVPFPPPQDHFELRMVLSGWSGLIGGTNLFATREPGEPLHAGKVGGKSVWYSWTAPTNGIARFYTVGSTFDTLLGIYTGTEVAALTAVASDEDRGGYLTSELEFNAQQGIEYAIAIDGFAGAAGDFALAWELEATPDSLPGILTQPVSQTVIAGDNVTLSASVGGAKLACQWWFNGRPIPGATNATFTIRNVQAESVGYYSLRVSNPQGRWIESLPASLEIGPVAGLSSQDKPEDLFVLEGGQPLVSAPVRPFGNAPFVSVSIGTIGQQIIHNTNSYTQAREPVHCGVIGGASRWLTIKPTENGTLVVNTLGSAIDTVLAVYTWTNITQPMRVVACDDDSAPDGLRSIVRFNALQGTTYYVAVDGVGGVSGTVCLNWRFGVPLEVRPASAPQQVVRRGQPLRLGLWTAASPLPMRFQWWRNGAPLAWATNADLVLDSLRLDDGGYYEVTVSNLVEEVKVAVATVEVEPVMINWVESRFDDTAEDWSADASSARLAPQLINGNPGGYLAATNLSADANWYWNAPAKFLGNRGPAYGGRLMLDLRQVKAGAPPREPPTVVLMGGGLNLFFNLTNSPGTNWTSCSIGLREDQGWKKDNGTAPTRDELRQVLQSLAALQIRGDFGGTPGVCGLDNVVLQAPGVNETPMARLGREAGGTNLVFEWPLDAVGYRIEVTDSLARPLWSDLLPQPQPIVTNNQNRVPLPLTATPRFFRLKRL